MAVKIESLFNPFTIGMRVASVGPSRSKNPELVLAIAINNKINWKKEPYIHEWALVEAYFGFSERNGKMDQKYARDLMYVFNWIRALKNENFNKIVRPNRVPPLFLDKDSELLFQIKNIRENSLESGIMLAQFLTECVFRLADSGIFNLGGFLNPASPAY